MKINNQKLDIALANSIMSIKELSNATGIASETIVRIKNGKQNPKPKTVGIIAKSLNVKAEDLI